CVLNVFAEHSLKEKSLKEEGSTDLLTGLLNKVSFEREAKKFLATRARGENVALIILDFDNFKSVNDNYGHLAGDAILCKFGAILKGNFRAQDIIGRVGGDEFMVMITGCQSDEIIAKRCSDVLHELYIAKIDDFGGFSCSIGVGVDNTYCSFKELYKTADSALYQAKENGKARYVFEHRTKDKTERTTS
ncbi:MAG: GGDEF domain-containing protein, partial [Lachnospiraceae bacterium]|nr:GGDEF domain-containing protein [Lachnospiraceae bacterium]